MNNAEFIDGLRNRDPVAARYLNECFVPSIWRFVFFRVDRDPHLTEDIVAETVLSLVSAVSSDTSIDNAVAWLRTVALRRIQDHYRAAARVKHLLEQAQQQTPDTQKDDPAAQHAQELRRESVRDAMDELPENYRLALEWKYVDKLAVKEIAIRLDATEKGAESILFRARRALRDLLQTEHADAADANGRLRSTMQAEDASVKEVVIQKDKPPVSFTVRVAREN